MAYRHDQELLRIFLRWIIGAIAFAGSARQVAGKHDERSVLSIPYIALDILQSKQYSQELSPFDPI